MKKNIYVLSLSIVLSACAVGPDYKQPEINPPENFLSQDVLEQLNKDKKEDPLAINWWEGFRDKTLNKLVNRGLSDSYTLRASRAELNEALAAVRLSQSRDNVQIGSSFSAETEAEQENTGSAETNTKNSALAGAVTATLPIDVFGSYQRRIEAAQANLEEIQAAFRGDVLATSAEIASEYLTFRGNQKQLAILNESIRLQEKTLEIVRSRFKSGLSPDLDLQRAIASVENLRADKPPLEEELRNSRNRLSVLVGRYPGGVNALLEENSDIHPGNAPFGCCENPA